MIAKPSLFSLTGALASILVLGAALAANTDDLIPRESEPYPEDLLQRVRAAAVADLEERAPRQRPRDRVVDRRKDASNEEIESVENVRQVVGIGHREGRLAQPH